MTSCCVATAHVPHRASLTEHKFKKKIIKTLQTAVAENETKGGASESGARPVQLHRLRAHEAGPGGGPAVSGSRIGAVCRA